MSEDALSKAERYREAANRYSELAKEAQPGYLAEVYHKIAVQYLDDAAAPFTNRDDRPLRLPLSFHRLDSGRENAFRFLSGLPSEHAPASDASLT